MCFGVNGVCITRRGTVYFGASIHIFITLILFLGSSVRAYRKSTQLRDENRKEFLGGVLIAIYFFVLLMLGLLIFRATEQKNSKLLGWTSGIFITLETFAFVFNLLLLSPMGIAYDNYGFRNFGFTVDIVHIIMSCIFLIFLMAYCATIVMYINKLKETVSRHRNYNTYRDYEDGEAGTTLDVASRESSRIPSTYFNQRSQSQSALDDKPKLGSILEVIRETKRVQQLKDQQNKPQRSQSPLNMQTQSQQTQPHVQIIPQQPQHQAPMPPILKPEAPKVPQLSQPDVQVKAQQTQTPPVPPVPILQTHTHSQTLPHPQYYQRRLQKQQFMPKDYNQIIDVGPRSCPSYPSIITASVAPNRFRNPNAGIRTNAAGTLGRFDAVQSSGTHSGSSRTHNLLRQNSSSCSSMDPPNYDQDQWEQPRVQALKYNYGYNALRRGTHRSDYGLEV